MNELADKTIKKWEGTHDNCLIISAMEIARTNGHREVADQKWRWLTDDMTTMYEKEPDMAAATISYIKGWLQGASDMLFKAVFAKF